MRTNSVALSRRVLLAGRQEIEIGTFARGGCNFQARRRAKSVPSGAERIRCGPTVSETSAHRMHQAAFGPTANYAKIWSTDGEPRGLSKVTIAVMPNTPPRHRRSCRVPVAAQNGSKGRGTEVP